MKKKSKAKKKEERAVVELAQKRKKKTRESTVTDPWKEEPHTDLEVVMRKRGSMDGAHIDQVRRKALQKRLIGSQAGWKPLKVDGSPCGQWDTANRN